LFSHKRKNNTFKTILLTFKPLNQKIFKERCEMSFSARATRVSDPKTFIDENTGGSKFAYKTEQGAVHRLFFPAEIVDGETLGAFMRHAKSHTWGSGSEFRAALCVRDYVDLENGFDGSCVLCERAADAAAIVDYIVAVREAACTERGDARVKAIEKIKEDAYELRKVKNNNRFYGVVAQLAADKDGAFDAASKTPFDLKIFGWTSKTLEKFLTSLKGSDEEPVLAEREFRVVYPDDKNPARLVLNMSPHVVNPARAAVQIGGQLHADILAAVAEMNFDRAVELCRPEATMRSNADMKQVMDRLFRDWDAYKTELTVNPDAKYLEYTNVGGGDEAPEKRPPELTDNSNRGAQGEAVDMAAVDALLGLDE
jgi:hypothetical protein